jgi:hypothetical protein
MWGVFLKDFKDWEMSDFENCPSGKLERLRQLLRRQGVYVTLNIETATALYGMVLKTNYPVWTKEQIQEHLDKGFIFKSRYINNLLRKTLSPDPKSQDFRRAPPDREEDFAPELSNNYDNRGYDTNYDNRNRGCGTNYDKSTHECLRLLINELRTLQHGLDPELRTEKLFRNKLISVCQTLPVCQYAVVGSDLPLSTPFRVLVFCVVFTYRFGTPAQVRAI